MPSDSRTSVRVTRRTSFQIQDEASPHPEKPLVQFLFKLPKGPFYGVFLLGVEGHIVLPDLQVTNLIKKAAGPFPRTAPGSGTGPAADSVFPPPGPGRPGVFSDLIGFIR